MATNRLPEWLPPSVAASRPSSPGGGIYLHRATDTGAISLWDGSTWRSVGGGDITASQISDSTVDGRAVLTGTASEGRTALGLGTSATLDVGTSASTVAAGDDARITGAAQKSANLSDLASASTARTNLGLGSLATASSVTASQVSDSTATGRTVLAGTAAEGLAALGAVPTSRTLAGLDLSADRSATDLRTALEVSADTKTDAYTLSGSAHDFTADADWAPSTLYQAESGPTSTGLLSLAGCPDFYVVGANNAGGCARTATGLRLTDDGTSRNDCWPVLDAGAQIVIPLPAATAITITAEVATNLAGALATAPTYAGMRFAVLQASAAMTLPTALAQHTLYLFGSLSVLEEVITGYSASAAGSTSGGVTVRRVVFALRGPTVACSTGASGGPVTERKRMAWPRHRLAVPGPWALSLGIARNGGTLGSALWAELRSLTIEHTR